MDVMDAIKRHDVDVNNTYQEIQLYMNQYDNYLRELDEYTKQLQEIENKITIDPQTQYLDSVCNLKQIIEQCQSNLNLIFHTLNINISSYTDKLNGLLDLISQSQSYIDKSLFEWKRDQQLAANGCKKMKNIDDIKTQCEQLFDTIRVTFCHIKEADRFRENLKRYYGELPSSREIIDKLRGKTKDYITLLIASSFVIITQPSQVLKLNSKFGAEVRLLIGGKLDFQKSPTVEVSIVSETQANQINDRNKPGGESCGKIINNTAQMEYQSKQKQILSATFQNMQLKSITRTVKKGTESVTDETFLILFYSRICIGELKFEVWSFSLPVVVTVHVNQIPKAWATVIWHNAFAESVGRIQFNVPDEMHWENIANVLKIKFLAETGCELSDDNLIFLAQKALRTQNNMVLSWSQFCKEPLPQRKFTFWEWFYAAMKITKEHLRGPWTDGAIIGFIKRSDAEEMLEIFQPGTFLLRFSDSELGGITVVWLRFDRCVYSLQPFTATDLSTRKLADRLLDLQELKILYPNKDKNEVFGKYYTPLPTFSDSAKGYVRPFLKMLLNVIPKPNQTNVEKQLATHTPRYGLHGTNGQEMDIQSSPESSPENFNDRETPIERDNQKIWDASGNEIFDLDSLLDTSNFDNLLDEYPPMPFNLFRKQL